MLPRLQLWQSVDEDVELRATVAACQNARGGPVEYIKDAVVRLVGNGTQRLLGIDGPSGRSLPALSAVDGMIGTVPFRCPDERASGRRARDRAGAAPALTLAGFPVRHGRQGPPAPPPGAPTIPVVRVRRQAGKGQK